MPPVTSPLPPRALRVGDRVDILNFGVHPGVVVDLAPEVVIQGRVWPEADWIGVRTDSGRRWNGARHLIAFRAPAIVREAA